MSLVSRPTLRCAAVIWSRVTPQRFIQYSTALRSERSSRSVSMKPRLSLRPAMNVLPRLFPQRELGSPRRHGGGLPAMGSFGARPWRLRRLRRLLQAERALNGSFRVGLGIITHGDAL